MLYTYICINAWWKKCETSENSRPHVTKFYSKRSSWPLVRITWECREKSSPYLKSKALGFLLEPINYSWAWTKRSRLRMTQKNTLFLTSMAMLVTSLKCREREHVSISRQVQKYWQKNIYSRHLWKLQNFRCQTPGVWHWCKSAGSSRLYNVTWLGQSSGGWIFPCLPLHVPEAISWYLSHLLHYSNRSHCYWPRGDTAQLVVWGSTSLPCQQLSQRLGYQPFEPAHHSLLSCLGQKKENILLVGCILHSRFKNNYDATCVLIG